MADHHDGWFGLNREVLHYLAVVGAEKDEGGKYIISGEPVVAGLDDTEVVVPAGAQYRVDGKWKNLAAGLRSTSYGLGVKVY